MVLEWTPKEASLLLGRSFCVSLEAWETQNHQTFCMRLVHQSTAACALESLRDSKLVSQARISLFG